MYIYIIKIYCLLQLHVKRLNVVVIREQVSQWAQNVKNGAMNKVCFVNCNYHRLQSDIGQNADG